MNTIVITGASSGIGRASAELFASKGWTVIAAMRNPENGAAFSGHDNIHVYPMDITDAEQVKATSRKILEDHDVDVLFNNAGYGMKARFEDMTEESMQRSLDTNILGMARVTQQFIPHFKRRRSGMIVATTSIAGEMGLVLDGVYSAVKWAVTGMCEMLYFELAPYNIHVKTLVPGVVKTGFKMDGAGNMPGEYSEIVSRQVKFLVPDTENIETAEQAASDLWEAVNDSDKERMCYVTGDVAREIYSKRQEMGAEAFRKYYRKFLLG